MRVEVVVVCVEGGGVLLRCDHVEVASRDRLSYSLC
jgi:hypothetical protein